MTVRTFVSDPSGVAGDERQIASSGETAFAGVLVVCHVDLFASGEPSTLNEVDYPALAAIWDNEGDAIYDAAS